MTSQSDVLVPLSEESRRFLASLIFRSDLQRFRLALHSAIRASSVLRVPRSPVQGPEVSRFGDS